MKLDQINQLFDKVIAAQNQVAESQKSRELKPLIKNGTLLGAYADDVPETHFTQSRATLLTIWDIESNDSVLVTKPESTRRLSNPE